jgi:sarcosine oxidase subunit beta
MQRADVIIIGAGLMGSSTAFWLAKAGKSVLLVEKERVPCQASAVNAGGVRRLNRAMEEIPLSVAAMEMWPRLSSIVGSDCGFEPVGQVRIAPDEKAMAFFEQRVAQVRKIGFCHEELVSTAEIKKLVPAYRGNCRGGIVSRDDGHALPARTLRAFFNAACSAGAVPLTRCRIDDISPVENGFTVRSEDGRCFNSETVVNCSGAWGNRIASLVDDFLPLEPSALSMMVTARMPRFIKPVVGVHGRKLSFKQMANGTVVIGGAHKASLDMSKERTTIDFSEMRQSARTVLEHFPIMRSATIVRCWAGIEGIMKDGLPVIGESPSIPGLFHVCGFSAHGFQLSPIVGRLAASMILGKKPDISLKAFSVDRFNFQRGSTC